MRQIRFFADPGDAPTNLDARLSKIHLSAEEITLDIPLSERGGWNWWLIGGIGFIAAAAAFLAIQRIRKRRAAASP